MVDLNVKVPALEKLTAHAPRIHWAMDKSDAEDLLSLASLVHRRLDSAHMPKRV